MLYTVCDVPRHGTTVCINPYDKARYLILKFQCGTTISILIGEPSDNGS